MSESFADLFEESQKRSETRIGEVVTAEVVRIEHNFVVVNAGLKSEAYVPLSEFKSDKGELEVQVGEFVSVAIVAMENGYGDTIVSRDTAKRLASWMSLEKSLESGEFVTGTTIRQGQGRPDRSGQRHPRLPARLPGRHTSYQGSVSVRKQDHGIQGHQARPQAQQRRVVTPCRGRSHPWAKSAPS
jgi:hypothetical protein